MSKTFDLSTLNLSAGTHTITVKARASGYADSPASDVVSYVVTPETEPYWGKFTFHQDLGIIEKNQFPPTAVNFTSNNVSYTQISCGQGTIMYDNTIVYDNGWTNQAYRSVDFGGSENNEQNVDKRFGDWFYVHADVVKIGEIAQGGCFVAGTMVLMSDGSMKAIEKVVRGDEVLTYDEGTKQYDKGRVLGTIIHHTSRISRLTFASGATVDLTPGHPIYTKEGWKSLKEGDGFAMLKLGNMGLSINGEYDEIVLIEYYTTETPIEVYNLTIEGEHNYFVGEASVLCHNAGSK